MGKLCAAVVAGVAILGLAAGPAAADSSVQTRAQLAGERGICKLIPVLCM